MNEMFVPKLNLLLQLILVISKSVETLVISPPSDTSRCATGSAIWTLAAQFLPMTNNKVKPLVHWSLHWIRRILECVIKKVLRMGNRAQMVQTAVRSPGDYCLALHCGQTFVIPSFQSKVGQRRTIVARMSPNGRHCFFFTFFKKISLTSSA